ncbi:hypothetical protein GCM10027271_26830 [Saccharopolyspora gloriosae]
MREHRDGARAELIARAEGSNRDFATVGDEDLAKHAGYLLDRCRTVGETVPRKFRLPRGSAGDPHHSVMLTCDYDDPAQDLAERKSTILPFPE